MKHEKELRLYIRNLLIVTVVTGLLVNIIPKEFSFDIIRGLILSVFIILFFRYKRSIDSISRTIILHSLLVLTMAGVTLLKYSSFNSVAIKFLISSVFYIIGYNLIKDLSDFRYLLKSYLYALLLILTSIFLLNLFGVSPSQVYSQTSINLGPQGVNTTKNLPLLLFPLLLLSSFPLNRNQRLLLLVSLSLTLILLLIGQKRGAVLGSVAGLVVYSFMSDFVKANLRNLVLIAAILLIASPLYWKYVSATFEQRQDQYYLASDEYDSSFEEESRYFEASRYFSDLKNRNINQILFGMGFKSEHFYYNTNRMLHTDYMLFLEGTGLLGLFLYLLVYFQIIKKANFLTSDFKKVKVLKNTRASIYSIVIAALIIAISGLSQGLTLRALVLLFLGGSVGYLQFQYQSSKIYSKLHG